MPISSSTKIEGATSRYLKLRSPKRRCIGSAGPAVESDCDTRTLLKLSAAAPCAQPAAEWGRVTKSAAARSYTQGICDFLHKREERPHFAGAPLAGVRQAFAAARGTLTSDRRRTWRPT